jgi:hypothetical protein
MSGNGADRKLWGKILLTARCGESAAEDATLLEEQEGAAQVRVAQQLEEEAGLDRETGWVSQPGWISDSDSELTRIASFAINPCDYEGVLWEEFKQMEQQTEQQRFRLFVHRCARDWMAVAEEAAGVAQEDEDAGASQGDEQGDEQESDAGGWTVVLVENLDSSVTVPMLQATFAQIGCVQWAEMAQDEGADWGWVGFERSEDAEEAVQRFGGVEMAGEPMRCTLISSD